MTLPGSRHEGVIHILYLLCPFEGLGKRATKLAVAAAAFERALQLKPDYPEAHFNLGFLLTQGHRLAEAVACYERALALRPDFVEAHNALGAVLLTQGQPAAAIACFERALQLKPGF